VLTSKTLINVSNNAIARRQASYSLFIRKENEEKKTAFPNLNIYRNTSWYLLSWNIFGRMLTTSSIMCMGRQM